MGKVIEAEGLSKMYRIGQFSSGTISQDISRSFARLLGKDDPLLKIGEENIRSEKGSSSVVWSLKDVSFSIEQGETLGVIGKNGAGKSTLLKLLSRVTSPTTGVIKAKGRIASLLEVGTGFHPELTGRENVYLNGSILGMRRKEISKKFDEIVAFSGVDRYIDTPVKRYSSGMYVRLAFAVAAHLESEILIVDEVLAVGDAEFQRKCYDKMQEISTTQGRTILFVSHNLASVKRLCNKGLYLSNGMTAYHGDISSTIANYLVPSGTNSQLVPGKYDFQDRQNVYGPKVIIEKVTLSNNAGKVGNVFSTGDDLIVDIHLRGIASDHGTMVGVLIKSMDGFTVSSLNTGMVKPTSLENRGDSEILRLTLPKMGLIRNKYFLDISVANGSKRLDFVENQIELDVLDGDYYGTGYRLEGARWNVCIEGSWEFMSDER